MRAREGLRGHTLGISTVLYDVLSARSICAGQHHPADACRFTLADTALLC